MADLYNFGAMLAFSMAHLSLIGLRLKEPDLARPFRLRPNIRIAGKEVPVTALFGFCATFGVWLIVVVTHVHGRNLGFLWMGVGLLLYTWYRKRAHLPVMETVEIEKVSLPDYQKLKVKNVLVPVTDGPHTENVQFACQLARTNAHVTALYILEIPSSLPLDTFLPEKLASADAATKGHGHRAEYDLQVTSHLLQARSAGKPSWTWRRERGRPDRDGQLLPARGGRLAGIDAGVCVRNAPCRVLICKSASK